MSSVCPAFFFFFFFHLYFIEALCILMDKASRRASVSMAYKGRSSHHAVTTHTFPASREDALNDLAWAKSPLSNTFFCEDCFYEAWHQSRTSFFLPSGVQLECGGHEMWQGTKPQFSSMGTPPAKMANVKDQWAWADTKSLPCSRPLMSFWCSFVTPASN